MARKIGGAGHGEAILRTGMHRGGERRRDIAQSCGSLRFAAFGDLCEYRNRGGQRLAVTAGSYLPAHRVHIETFQVRRHRDNALFYPPRAGNDHEENTGSAEPNEFQVAQHCFIQRRVLDDRDLLGEVGKQSRGAIQHIIKIHRGIKDLTDSAPFRSRKRLDGSKGIYERAVAGIGGDAPGRGMRMGEQPGFFQDRHIITHGSRGHSQRVAFYQSFGSHRFAGGDVIAHNRLKNAPAPIFCRHLCSSSPLSTLYLRVLILRGDARERIPLERDVLCYRNA